ncbi:ATP-binding protein [Xanthovirga aplysinae]|uniref:ATP-binding protein n=1 Tax=Xanthovirga aplysinae TaxID=2529853 RepID=UPI0031B57D21|nr:ATP-binding protein [Xanthovirga aplysinae]
MQVSRKVGEIEIKVDVKKRQLVIRDNGPGISDEVAKKLFTPFFSTKMNGQGIGLTLCREILLNHQFTFSLFTAKDCFTYFEVGF